MAHERSKKERIIDRLDRNRRQRTRAVFVGTVDAGSGGDLIVCECGRLDDDLVLLFAVVVFSRLASASAFTFCFIASVGSTYHLRKNVISLDARAEIFSYRFLSYF